MQKNGSENETTVEKLGTLEKEVENYMVVLPKVAVVDVQVLQSLICI